MLNLLKGLLGKTARHIIVNGSLILQGKKPLKAALSNYHVVFSVDDQTLVTTAAGIKIIEESIANFSKNYPEFVGANEDKVTVSGKVDNFTGAIILTCSIFERMLESRFHSEEMQFSAERKSALDKFTVDYIQNYYVIYLYLYHWRLNASYMPAIIKGHLVAGLFQPLILETNRLQSPLSLGDLDFIYNRLQKHEIILEEFSSSTRVMKLSVIAMSDFCNEFNLPLVTQMDRKHFLFALFIVVLMRYDHKSAVEFSKKHIYSSSAFGKDPLYIEFFRQLVLNI